MSFMAQLSLLDLWIAVSLVAPLCLVWARDQRWFPSDQLKLLFSAGMWSIVAIDLVALTVVGDASPGAIGLRPFAWISIIRGVAVGGLGLVLAGGLLTITRRSGASSQSREAISKLAKLPLSARLFVLVTVAVTEEVAFRAFPIGATSLIRGPVFLVALLGLSSFVLAHVQWGRSHATFVVVIGAFLTGAFLVFRDAGANMIAHAIIDVPPLLFARAMLRKMDDVVDSTPV